MILRCMWILLVFLLGAGTITAQVYDSVTHLSGTQQIGKNDVTVTSANGGSYTFCNMGPYRFGGKTTGAGSYTFTFSRLVANVRIPVGFLGYGGPNPDVVSFAVNGLPYPLTPPNVTGLDAVYWCTRTQAVIQGGDLFPASGETGAEVNIPGGIYSVTISCNDLWNGVSSGFFFENFYASSNAPVCWDDTLKLFSGPEIAGATFLWQGPAGFTSTLRNPVIPNAQAVRAGDYIVRITVPGGIVTDTVPVVMSPRPAAIINFTSPVCVGSTLQLRPSASDLPGTRYVWSGPRDFSDTIASPEISPVVTGHAGVYHMTATLGVCSVSADTVITVSKPSFHSITKVICSNESIDFNGNNINEAGTYHDTLIAANGCDSIITLDLAALPAPEVSITTLTDTLCKGGDTVLFTAGGASRYTWYNIQDMAIGNGTALSAYISETDNRVKLVGVADNECTDTVVSIIPFSGFRISLTASDTLLYPGEALRLETGSAHPYTVTGWGPPELFGDQQAPEQAIYADTTRRYTVRARSGKGCMDTASVLVKTKVRVFLPTAFSPNGDGLNDVFRPAARGGGLSIRTFRIFDRWGRVVWETARSAGTKGWDGMTGGSPAEMGVYFYTIDVETDSGEKIEQTGSVTLVR